MRQTINSTAKKTAKMRKDSVQPSTKMQKCAKDSNQLRIDKNAPTFSPQDAAMVLEEQPGKVCEALRLFLQGQGYCLNIRKLSAVGPTL